MAQNNSIISTNEKRFTYYDFQNSIEFEENQYTFSADNSLTSHFNFLNAAKSNYTSVSSNINNNVYTLKNSNNKISYSALYENIRSYLYQNNYAIQNSIVNQNQQESLFARQITIPLNCLGDTIKPGSFGFNLSSNSVLHFSRFLSLNNSKNIDYGRNSAYVLFNDERWLNEKLDSCSSNFTFELAIKPKYIDNSSASTVTQYLIYRARIVPRNSLSGMTASGWTYSSSAIPSNQDITTLQLEKSVNVDTSITGDSVTDIAYGLAMTYYKPISNSSLSGSIVFDAIINGEIVSSFQAINSSLTANSQTGVDFSSLTSIKNLYDNQWHHLIWNWNTLDASNTRLYLDGVRLPAINNSSTAGQNPVLTVANYKLNNMVVKVPTTLLLGSKLQACDQQITTDSMRVIFNNQENISFLYQRKNFEAEYGSQFISQAYVNQGLIINSNNQKTNNPSAKSSQVPTSLVNIDTNIYSYFGAVNNLKYLSSYYNGIVTSDRNPDIYTGFTDSDLKKNICSNIISENGIRGYIGDLGFFYIHNASLTDGDGGVTISEYVGSITANSFSATEIALRFTNRDPKKSNVDDYLIGNYQFWKEDLMSLLVKNKTKIKNNSEFYYKKNNASNNEAYYDYYGAGIFVNHLSLAANSKINAKYDFQDLPQSVFDKGLFKTGSIIYKGNESSKYSKIGVIYYDLGLLIFDNNQLIPTSNLNSTSFINSISADTNITWSTSTTSNFIMEEMSYIVQKYRYCNYLDVNLNEFEFNNSTNPSSQLNQNVTYPTTIGLYNDNDEMIAVAKINQKVEKSSLYNINYKVKLAY
jgi:hypothetical protein